MYDKKKSNIVMATFNVGKVENFDGGIFWIGRENLASMFLWVRGLIQVGTFGYWCLKCC